MIFSFDDWELDTEQYELRHRGRPRRVDPQVFDFLHYLMLHADRVVSREEIVGAIWDGRIVAEAAVSTCLKGARRAVGDDGKAQRLIRTVRGRGFRFVGRLAAGTPAPNAALTGGGERSLATSPAAPDRPVVAVLPFENLSAEAEAYFADGVSEDIITNLTRFRDLRVIARSASFRFKDRAVEPVLLGAALEAGYLVQGSVRRAGDRVRISAQLIDAASGVHLWADSFDRGLSDIFEVQDEVARTIAAALGVQVQDVALQRALKKSPSALDAYDLVLRARRYTRTLSAEMHAEARDQLERAVALDPSNADAHALLANVYLAEHRFETNPRPDPIGRALAMAETASRLDPLNAQARCWLAIVHFFRGANASFEAEAARALALNPSDPEILANIGHYLAFMGAFERGLELSRRAQQLNPLHPGWYHFSAARCHYDRRDYETVLADLQRIAMPQFYWTHLLEAAALGQLGRAEAAAALDRIFALKPGFSARTELAKWNAAPDDLAHLIDGLRKAGLDE